MVVRTAIAATFAASVFAAAAVPSHAAPIAPLSTTAVDQATSGNVTTVGGGAGGGGAEAGVGAELGARAGDGALVGGLVGVGAGGTLTVADGSGIERSEKPGPDYRGSTTPRWRYLVPRFGGP